MGGLGSLTARGDMSIAQACAPPLPLRAPMGPPSSRALEPDCGPSPVALTTLQFVLPLSAYLFSPLRSRNHTQYQAQCLLLGVSGIMTESARRHVYLQSCVSSLGRKLHSSWLHIVLKAQRYLSPDLTGQGAPTGLCSLCPLRSGGTQTPT